jgi:hypothetical protein
MFPACEPGARDDGSRAALFGDKLMKRNVQFSIALARIMGVVTGGVALVAGVAALPVHANVFASNLRLSGTTSNLTTTPGDAVPLTYVLNEAASAGLTVTVFAGTNAVWSTNVSGASPNAVAGAHSLTWSGHNDLGQVVSNGLWNLRVTAKSTGHTNWSQISNDTTNRVHWPRGIAVNNNTGSFYFGRVFSCNADNFPANPIGLLKFNADGSPAAEGGFSDGGRTWSGGGNSPFHVKVDAEDRVLTMAGGSDWGMIYAFDQVVATNSRQSMFTAADSNYWANTDASFSGFFVSGSGTNRMLYAADNSSGVNVGIRRWNLNASGLVNSNDTGVTVVTAGGGASLNGAAFDVAVDGSGRIYTVQNVLEAADPSPRVLRFPAFTNTTLTVADWAIGGIGSYLTNAQSIAIALNTNWLAVGCQWGDTGSGSLVVLKQDDGALVKVVSDGSEDGLDHDYLDVAWDLAGNLYAADLSAAASVDYGTWRVFSPPGTNQFTTTALQTVKVGPYQPPTLAVSQLQSGQLQGHLVGEPGVRYVVELSTNLLDWNDALVIPAQAFTNAFSAAVPNQHAFLRARIDF